ncbi:SPFH domain-containing protein [Psychromonas antarctica]|jgi:membrane protease subunit (stomatin/prohibitin family)|uniref:SPFH domain-containing protein n=1 Tax=Psychromonas antarctica TaxID=67573 RepID=UPI001EE938EB|nr:SPFH domain-containing protein [Psychromonas antarctica]MCG6201990.1 SPFH domain-containing protein [Psychromonas antarctica]
MDIIDRVKYDGPNDVFAWRWPHDGLVWGTQVIVNQAQQAVFYKNGKALDVLDPGRHTLKSANIPLLEHIVNIPFGNQTPFAAEIYFVNKAVNLDMKWGTQEPIPILDPIYKVFLPVRAFGQFGMTIIDAKKFVSQLVGTVDEFNAQQVSDYFRGHLMSCIKDFISTKIINENISILTISTQLNEMSATLKHDISAEFKRFGIEIVNFYLNSINVPEDDDSVVRLKEMLAKKAEFDLYGEHYNTVKTFDVAEKAASNEGEGNVASAGVGMGVGMGIGNKMMNMNADLMDNSKKSKQSSTTNGSTICPSCQQTLPDTAKFCFSCGTAQTKNKSFCIDCGNDIPLSSKFCPSCGKKQ